MAVWRKDARKRGLEHGSAPSTRLSDIKMIFPGTHHHHHCHCQQQQQNMQWVCACIYVCYKQWRHNLQINHLLNFLFFIILFYVWHIQNMLLFLFTHTLSQKHTIYIYTLHTAMPHSLCTTDTEHVHIYHTTIHACLSQKMNACANSEHRTHYCFSIPDEPLVLCNSGALLSNNSLTFQSHWLLPCHSLPL